MAVEGKPEVTLKQGNIYHMPYKKVHLAKAATEGAKIVVFRVHEKGQPERISAQ